MCLIKLDTKGCYAWAEAHLTSFKAAPYLLAFLLHKYINFNMLARRPNWDIDIYASIVTLPHKKRPRKITRPFKTIYDLYGLFSTVTARA